jgi:hypothetical protein
MIYRILLGLGGALALAACSTPDWMSLDSLKPGPSLDSVSLESEPPGAEAKASNGQICRTPCTLALPVDTPMTVTFSLSGFQPESERLEVIRVTGDPPRLRPNPVVVELTAAEPAAKVAKKPAGKRPTAKRPAARPTAAAAPATAATAATAPTAASPAQPASPWPTTPPPTRQ